MIRALGVLVLLGGCARAWHAEWTVGEFRPVAQRSIVPAGAALELLWGEGEFTEGPAAAPDGAILFSDIGNRIMKFDPASGKVSVFRDPSGKANGLVFDGRGQLFACEGGNGGNRRISVTESGKARMLADRWRGKRFNSPNDLALDAGGNVYFTDPRYVGDEPREIDFEGVFRVSPDGKVALATRDLQKPNGILIDGDTAWVADNNGDPKGNHHLLAFRIRPDGSFGEKRVVFDFGPDRRGIDGMALDARGNVYATAGRGERGGVYVFGPRGEHLAFIPTPGDPTNCAFDAKGNLYVTAGTGGGKFGLFRIRLR